MPLSLFARTYFADRITLFQQLPASQASSVVQTAWALLALQVRSVCIIYYAQNDVYIPLGCEAVEQVPPWAVSREVACINLKGRGSFAQEARSLW
jgi:hypothetical protein